MKMLWYGLMANLAIIAIFVTSWTHAKDWLAQHRHRGEPVAFGATMGLGAIAVMAFPVELSPGIFFDLRATLMALAGAFGGPIAALVAVGLAAPYRLALGGAGAPVGVVALLIPAAIGSGYWLLLKRRESRGWQLFSLAIVTGIASASTPLMLPAEVRMAVLTQVSAPQAMLIACALMLSALALRQDDRRRALMQENSAYRTIIEALPDSLNVKDPQGRFVTANPATARLMRATSPAELIGRSDADFYPPEVAAAFAADEARMIEGGEILAIEQVVHEEGGKHLWLSTLKVPLRDQNGEIVGIITHNRDVTDRKILALELERSQTHLEFALAQMTDGVAIFGADARLVYCNEQYRRAFPRSGPLRVPGAHIRDILQGAMERQEQLGIDDIPAWIDEVESALFRENEEEVHLFDGRWLRVSTRPTDDGGSMVVVSEITKLKQAEFDLMGLAEQLKQQAATDGLTGLTNRWAMDQALEAELQRTGREGLPLSVILLDIDWFKPYNDHYGHLAGDEALRVVARCFAQTFRRPGDIVARYGGEEFCAILPSTDEDGAYHLANVFRGALARRALPHAESPRAIVTASLGVATYGSAERRREAAEIIARADEALYVAKSAGRDRVYGWHPRDEGVQKARPSAVQGA